MRFCLSTGPPESDWGHLFHTWVLSALSAYSDTVQVLLQEQALWYFPHLCPGWLATVSMPVTGSSLSLSSLFKKKTKKPHQFKLNSLLKSAKLWATTMISSGAQRDVSQRTWVHYRSPPVVCCGCRFVASSAAEHNQPQNLLNEEEVKYTTERNRDKEEVGNWNWRANVLWNPRLTEHMQ